MEPGTVTQDDLQLNGTWTGVAKKKLEDKDAKPFFSWTNHEGLPDHQKKNGWKGADLNPHAPAGQDFLVKSTP